MLLCKATTQSIGWTHFGKNMVDTRAIILSQATLDSKFLYAIDDSRGYYMEHAMHDALSKTGKKFLFFKRPFVRSLSGSTGSFTKMNFFKKLLIQAVTILAGRFLNV